MDYYVDYAAEKQKQFCKDKFGWNLLIYAARKGDSKMVNQLIYDNIDPTIKSDHNVSAVTFAAASGDLETIRLLLDTVHDTDTYSACSVSIASLHGHGDIVQLLFTRHPEKISNPTQLSGMTPLMLATVGGHVKIVELLLEMGAKCITSRNELGLNALDMACMLRNREIENMLRSHAINEIDFNSPTYGLFAPPPSPPPGIQRRRSRPLLRLNFSDDEGSRPSTPSTNHSEDNSRPISPVTDNDEGSRPISPVTDNDEGSRPITPTTDNDETIQDLLTNFVNDNEFSSNAPIELVPLRSSFGNDFIPSHSSFHRGFIIQPSTLRDGLIPTHKTDEDDSALDPETHFVNNNPPPTTRKVFIRLPSSSRYRFNSSPTTTDNNESVTDSPSHFVSNNPLPSTFRNEYNIQPSASRYEVNPLPSTSRNEVNPLPSTSRYRFDPQPSTSRYEVNPLPSTSRYRFDTQPSTFRYEVNPLPSTSRYRFDPQPSTSRYGVNQSPSTYRYDVGPSPSTSRYGVNQSPSTYRCDVVPSPSTSRYRIFHPPTTDDDDVERTRFHPSAHLVNNIPSPSTSRNEFNPRPSTSRYAVNPSPSMSRNECTQLPTTSRYTLYHSPTTDEDDDERTGFHPSAHLVNNISTHSASRNEFNRSSSTSHYPDNPQPSGSCRFYRPPTTDDDDIERTRLHPSAHLFNSIPSPSTSRNEFHRSQSNCRDRFNPQPSNSRYKSTPTWTSEYRFYYHSPSTDDDDDESTVYPPTRFANNNNDPLPTSRNDFIPSQCRFNPLSSKSRNEFIPSALTSQRRFNPLPSKSRNEVHSLASMSQNRRNSFPLKSENEFIPPSSSSKNGFTKILRRPTSFARPLVSFSGSKEYFENAQHLDGYLTPVRKNRNTQSSMLKLFWNRLTKRNDDSEKGKYMSEVNDLKFLMKKAKLEQFYHHFEAHEIDIDTFNTLTNDDLKHIGIENMADRLKIRKRIYKYMTKD